MKQNSEKSSKVAKQDREYLDQSDLHSNQDQDQFNKALSSLSEAQIHLAAQRLSKLIDKKRIDRKK